MYIIIAKATAKKMHTDIAKKLADKFKWDGKKKKNS